MTSGGHVRQEVVNVLLAQLLAERGFVAVPEQVSASRGLPRQIPDVVVDFQGLRLAIEGEFADAGGRRGPGAAELRAAQKVLERVERGIAHIGIAVVYPRRLREIRDVARLKENLSRTRLRFAIITERVQQQLPLFRDQPGALPFMDRDVEALGEAIRRAYEPLVRDEVLAEAVALIEAKIGRFSDALRSQPGTAERFAEALEVRTPSTASGGSGRRESGIRPNQRNAVKRIAGLVLINAMIFQEVLSWTDSRVRPLHTFSSKSDLIRALAEHWSFILNEINYYPIFFIACRLLDCISSDRDVQEALREMIDASRQIVGWRAALSHDLAGRIYHRLLEYAKYLGAYYTSIPAAVLLLKLALNPNSWDYDWSNLDQLRRLRIGDLACGTGTLLMAAADAVVDNYVRSCAARGVRPRLRELHQILLGEILWGFDVLDSAVHLTASTLALRNPEVPVDVTHLMSLELGGPEHRVGSLEFLESRGVPITSMFSPPEQVVGAIRDRDQKGGSLGLPAFDLCVMNPPFTRDVGGNLLFGQFPESEREQLKDRLKRLMRRRNLSASLNAGLGAVFAAMGDMYLREGGRMALVVPRALLSGVSWRRTRKLIERNYHLEWIIVSHEPNHWNFSENTNLSEVLIIARKREPSREDQSERVVCVNLWKQPRNSVEALALTHQLLERDPPNLLEDFWALELYISGEKVGEAVSVPWNWLSGRVWSLPCAFAQSELVRALVFLLDGSLYLPGGLLRPIRDALPLCPLGRLGELGPDVRQVHDVFEKVNFSTPYPAFWNHDASTVTSMAQAENAYLRPRHARQYARRAPAIWDGAANLLIAERLRLNTMRLSAIFLNRSVLSNVWWPFSAQMTEDQQKALAVWLNSTLGFLVLLAHRVETEGPWVKFKKNMLLQMPVLDVARLDHPKLQRLATAYDSLAREAFRPFPEMAEDTTREAIDGAISEALGLPDLSGLRELLPREPIVSLSLDFLVPSIAPVSATHAVEAT